MNKKVEKIYEAFCSVALAFFCVTVDNNCTSCLSINNAASCYDSLCRLYHRLSPKYLIQCGINCDESLYTYEFVLMGV